MTEQTIKPQSLIMRYGLYLGLLNIVMGVLTYISGAQTSGNALLGGIISAVSLILMAVIIVAAIREYKKANDGYLLLGQAIKIGLGVALIGGIISVLYTYVFTTYIEPEYMQQILDAQLEKMLQDSPQMTQAQLDAAREMATRFSSPMITMAFGLISSLFLGFIISLITGAVLQKKSPEQQL
ncbi:MAG: DUF4199 domain-containing protein [Capnocytophaga sp.]|nr:DUF4199 domain-containing protein [Capnocytophaga sp.]